MKTVHMKNTKTVLFRLVSIFVIIIMMTCEEQVYDNPFDAEAELNPNEWAPSNLQVQAISDSEIKLTWTQVEKRISGFIIERKADSAEFIQISAVNYDKTEFNDTELNYGTDYTFRVKAFTDHNESNYDTSNMTSTSFPPPTNLTAIPINDQSIQLTWSDNCNFELGYRLERSNGGDFTLIAEVGENITEFIDADLTLDANYSYRVKAFTELNESEFTNSVEITLFYDCEGIFMGTVIEDCYGDCNGTAFINGCEYCVEGNTGLYADYCYVTDIDGNTYTTVFIGDQIWMAENLKVTHYRDGISIPTGYSNSSWKNLSTSAYAVYEGNENNTAIYGYLYNWHAINDSSNIAPEGWHVPADSEWTTLIEYLGSNAGSKLAGNADLWIDGNLVNNPDFGTSGFTALPSGLRNYVYGEYGGLGFYGYFWSSTEYNYDNAIPRIINYHALTVAQNNSSKRFGFSVRCVKD